MYEMLKRSNELVNGCTKKNYNLKLGTCNIRTMLGPWRMVEIAEEVLKFRLNLVVLLESDRRIRVEVAEMHH